MKSFKLVGIVGLLAGLCLSSQATLLLPGGSGAPDAPQLPGSDILATLVSPFSGGGGISGTVTSWVVANSPGNTLGGLSFYYQVDVTGTLAVGGFTASDFGISSGSPVEVATVSGAFDSSVTGGQIPVLVNRSATPGSVVRFFFSGVSPGSSSAVLIVNTAYQSFQVSAGGVLNSSTADVSILGPALVPIPEPSTVMDGGLLLLPLAASALRIVRKR